MRRKTGWTVMGIVGFIFAPIGFIFMLVSVVLRKPDILQHTGSAVWKHADDPMILQAVFGSMGCLFLILGLIFLGFDLRRKMLLKRAFDGGLRVEAEITGISTVNNVKVNHRHPRVVECAYTDASGVVHIYRSRYLYTDVSKLLTSKTVPVYLDRFNENIGFVDIDAVLPEIRVHP